MTDHLTPADVERIRERADKATKGNWFWDVRTGIVRLVTRERGQVFVLTFTRAGLQGAVPCVQVHDERCDGECHGCGKMVRVDSLGEPNYNGIVDAHHPDLDFIAHARTDVPALCDTTDALRETIAALQDLSGLLLAETNTQVATLRATLAERDAEIQRLKEVLRVCVDRLRETMIDQNRKTDNRLLSNKIVEMIGGKLPERQVPPPKPTGPGPMRIKENVDPKKQMGD